jgi:hypothetical protein
MREKQTSQATLALKQKTFRKDTLYADKVREVIKEFSDCPNCRQGYFCFPTPCFSAYELARTLTTLKVETRRGKSTEWSTTQGTRELKNFKRRSRQFKLQQKIEDQG